MNNKNRFVNVLKVLAVAVMACSLSMFAYAADEWDGTVDTAWYNNTDISFTIDEADEFAGLAQLVNNGTDSFAGKTVTLADDIDLDQVDWTPIGTSTYPFLGTFDGGNNTISNLWGDTNANGLFGYTSSGNRGDNYGSEAIIKNFTVDGAVITDNLQKHNGAGAIVGCGNMYTTIKNVNVTGDIIIIGARSGGILGYAYSGAVIDNCHVIANASSDNKIDALYWACGGIMGFAAPDGDVVITNCSVKNVDINAINHYGAGGILGNGGTAGKVEDVSVENVTCSVAYANDAVYYISGGPTATGNVEVVNTSAFVNGEKVEVSGEDTTNIKLVVAKIGTTGYATLQDAVDAAEENDVIVLVSDIYAEINPTADSTSSDSNALIHTDKDDVITIDLNGRTISVKGADEAKYDTLAIRNNGTLTIKDTAGDGKITLAYNGTQEVGSSQIHSTILNFGTLTIKSGIIENTATTGYSTYGIYNYSWGGNAILTVDGGTISSDRNYAIIQAIYDDFSKNNNFVTINKGEINGGVYCWHQGACADSKLEINGGTITAGEDTYALRLRTTGSNVLNAKISDKAEFVGETKIQASAKFNDKYYTTIAQAILAAENNDVVTVLPGTYTESLIINKPVILTGDPNYGKAGLSSANASFEKPVITITEVTNGGVEYNAPNVVFDNLVFKVAEGATGSGWNVSAIGYYYETVADRDGLTVTNCDFINESDMALTAIAANISSYTITGNTFENFAGIVYSYVDHGKLGEVVISNNTFDTADNLVTVYWGADNGDASTLEITNNTSTTGAKAKINVDDFGRTKATPVRAIAKATITGNDAETILSNFNNENVIDAGNYVHTYSSVEMLEKLDGTLPDGTIYVKYGTENEVMYLVVDKYYKLPAEEITVDFRNITTAEGDNKNTVWEMYLVANQKGVINRLNSADFTFALTTDSDMTYEIASANEHIVINNVNNDENRFEFHYDTKSGEILDTAVEIKVATITFTGYGAFTFGVDTEEVAENTNQVHTTTFSDNIVDSFVAGTNLIVTETISATILVPTRTLTIKVSFPNAVIDNAIAYQDMKVEITGNIDGETQTITYNLGKSENEMNGNGEYVVEESKLVLNDAYTVTVSGAGYRTARYTVTMTDSKTINFWNNVKDNETAIEEGKKTAKTTFLAGDIVKDGKINIYDLSAVVSYFGEIGLSDSGAYNAYAKYDLNRDGKIDSKDVAYVLVSWNN